LNELIGYFDCEF